jgi:hypothetical protein
MEVAPLWEEPLVAPLWEQVGADLWDRMEALEAKQRCQCKMEALGAKQRHQSDEEPKVGLLGLKAPLLEMIALLLGSKLGSIWTEGWKKGPEVLLQLKVPQL